MENDDKKKDEGQAQTTETTQKGSSADKSESAGKTIHYGSDKSFTVSDDIAQAHTQFTTEVDRRLGENSQELGELREYKRNVLQREQDLQAKTNKQDLPDPATQLFEDPSGFVGSIDQKIEKIKTDMRTEYQQAETTKKDETNFWNSIWAENKDLEMVKTQATDVIKMIGQKYADQNLPNTKQVRDFLAKEARGWMKGIIGTNANGSTDGFVEGSSTTTPVRPKKEEDKPRTTTAEYLTARREKKRKAVAERT